MWDVGWGLDPQVSYMLGKHLPTELHPSQKLFLKSKKGQNIQVLKMNIMHLKPKF